MQEDILKRKKSNEKEKRIKKELLTEKAAGILVCRNNQVLLVRHGPASRKELDIYGVPSGRVEPGETEREGAIREFREETGAAVAGNDLIDYPSNLYFGEVELKDGTVHCFEFKVFAAKNIEGELKATDETTPEWVDIGRLDELKLFMDTRTIAMQVFEYFKK